MDYDPSTGEINFWVEGVAAPSWEETLALVERNGKPNELIKATLIMDGRDVVHDEVKYLVVTKDSFFYQLQTRPEVRAELVARGVYDSPDDLPNFGLKTLSTTDMEKLGIPPEIIALSATTQAPAPSRRTCIRISRLDRAIHLGVQGN